MKIDIQDLLKGMRPFKDESGNIVVQSINNMQIVCLTTDDEYNIDKFGNPMSLLASTRSYGDLTVHNNEDKPVLMPAQATYITAYQAQDHSAVKAAYVPASSSRDLDDSCCVQSTQGGYISNSESGLTRTVLPFYLKETAFANVGVESYNKLWPSIESFNNSVNSNGDRRAHIVDYFKKHGKKLEQFIAHFEKPQKCIGAIVLVEGEIVSIEKFPSFTYTDQVWDTLIRDCYGSIAITEEIKNVNKENKFSTLASSNKQRDGESTAEYLTRILNKTKKSIEDDVKEKIEEIFDVEFQKTLDNSKDGYKSEILESDGYIGQVISESGYNHLVSIVKRSAFDPKRLRKASEMRRKAKGQDRFSL